MKRYKVQLLPELFAIPSIGYEQHHRLRQLLSGTYSLCNARRTLVVGVRIRIRIRIGLAVKGVRVEVRVRTRLD